MSDAIVGCHKFKHFASLFVVLDFGTVDRQSEAFGARLLENFLEVGEFSSRRIAAQVDAFDDVGMSLAQLGEQLKVALRHVHTMGDVDGRNEFNDDVWMRALT